MLEPPGDAASPIGRPWWSASAALVASPLSFAFTTRQRGHDFSFFSFLLSDEVDGCFLLDDFRSRPMPRR